MRTDMRQDKVLIVALTFLVTSLTVCGNRIMAQRHDHQSLGKVEFPVSCTRPAQEAFNTAAALLHHMTYPRAREAFEEIAKNDPKCAMAHWGVAMTLFQPLWPTRPSPADLRVGWESVQKAKELQPPTERERLFVAAGEAFFLNPISTDYWLRIRRWEAAMEKVYRAFPDDPEVKAFYSLAHLAVVPPTQISRTNADRAAKLLLEVFKENPDHPGAMHYLVHANDMPGRESELLEVTRKYETVAPRNPHALHMPTHIYTRLGDWPSVVRGNLLAAEAALDHPTGDKGQYIWDEFPHAVEYLVYARLQQGDDAEAAKQLKRIKETPNLEPSFKTAFHIASTQARYALERNAWDEAAALVPREPSTLVWDRFPWPEAIVQFARGLGAAHLGKAAEARSAIKRLDELEAVARSSGEVLFERNIQILGLELRAWLAHAEGDREKSVATMRKAVGLEESTPKHAVTPGPTLPANELLGDLLLAQRQPKEALAAYELSLEAYPNRFNSLLGAARAATALGDDPLSRSYYGKLLKVAPNSTRTVPLEEARKRI